MPWSHARLLFFLAHCCIFFKQHARALALLESVVGESPEIRRAAAIIWFLYAENGRFQDSITALQRAVALEPDSAASHFNLGFVLQKAHRHEEAIARLTRAIELNPALDRAWYGLGI